MPRPSGGLIRRRGASIHDAPQNIRRIVDTGEFSAMLVSYNWLQPYVREAIEYGAARGMGVSVMNPVGGGNLAENTPQILRFLPGAQSAAEVGLRYALSRKSGRIAWWYV